MFSSFDPFLIATAVLGTMTVALLVWVIRLERKLRRLCAGRTGASLEGVIRDIRDAQKDMEGFRDEMTSYLTGVERRLRRSVQGVETVRFNPFPGTGGGGNQSFSVAFLNEDGNGVVMSGLHARDHTRVYTKPVAGHTSEYELSDEERAVIKQAREKFAQQK